MKKPNFFILGAPKCGTTSIYHWLKQHKQVYFPRNKEFHFFSTDLNPSKRSVSDLDTYMDLFKKANETHKIVGEGSVFYLYSKTAVDNILDFNKDAKFLVMLRNPIEMVTSLHKQYLYSGNEIYEDFEKAWRLKEQRINGVGITKVTEDPQLLNYGKVCKLGEQIERLLTVVDKKKVKFILLENLKKQPKTELRELFKFLQIDNQDVDLRIFNKASARKYPKLNRAIKYLFKLKRESFLKNTSTGLKKNIKKMHKKFNYKSDIKIDISAEIKNELIGYFKEDILLLESILEVDCYSRELKMKDI